MPPLPKTSPLGKFYAILEAHGQSDWKPRPVPCRGGRRVGQTGGEILPTHVYRNEEQRWCKLLLCSVLFRLVAPPLQPGVVGPYLVQGVSFPSHLLLEGTGHIQNFEP
jgi:hypothetical protein